MLRLLVISLILFVATVSLQAQILVTRSTHSLAISLGSSSDSTNGLNNDSIAVSANSGSSFASSRSTYYTLPGQLDGFNRVDVGAQTALTWFGTSARDIYFDLTTTSSIVFEGVAPSNTFVDVAFARDTDPSVLEFATSSSGAFSFSGTYDPGSYRLSFYASVPPTSISGTSTRTLSYVFTAAAVPEPSVFALLLAGGVGIFLLRVRTRSKIPRAGSSGAEPQR